MGRGAAALFRLDLFFRTSPLRNLGESSLFSAGYEAHNETLPCAGISLLTMVSCNPAMMPYFAYLQARGPQQPASSTRAPETPHLSQNPLRSVSQSTKKAGVIASVNPPEMWCMFG
ncbi:hypothetical protein CSOJ01_06112 [Colletotrichum sojae]|uniref:Uncharacterized protein n=1 Tax=Colletotrichum sojae TaxID=2175907 RepID=A0A8H6JDX7_9PEZI|nr:hypothetical protein CSOJ01_06112 [Colletotrichum sojae]